MSQGFERSRYDRALNNLVDHLKTLSADTRALIGQTAEHSGEHLSRIRDRAMQTLAAVESRVGPLQAPIAERARAAARLSAQHLRVHRWSTIATAAAVVCIVAAFVAWQHETELDDEPTDID